jgi:hypothetical protein
MLKSSLEWITDNGLRKYELLLLTKIDIEKYVRGLDCDSNFASR